MPAEGGIKFGQYLLLRRLARGGMAEVFLAQQRGLEGFDRRVAVKRILPHLADSPDFVKMFLSEARLAAQLTHPNVVHIYDFGKVDHDYFIAMEFVDGVHTGDLFKHFEREKLPPTLVARIGADAATALHYAHELHGTNGKPLGLVHRDVSPANVMVSYDGTVKLCDFGIAKAAALGDQLTNPGQVKGKYAYMSPEQTVAAPLDGRSDVFSLAILLWELLAGKTIVSRGDTVEAMRAIRDGKLQPIDKAAPGTPAPLAQAIQWALETKRDKRATAMDLAQALEAFIKAAPELATPMVLGQWVRTRFPREATGSHPSLPASPGTQAAPGTVAAPGTSSGSQLSNITPPSMLIAASRAATYLADDHSETVAVGPPSMTERPSMPTIIDDHPESTDRFERRTREEPPRKLPAPPRPQARPRKPTERRDQVDERKPTEATVEIDETLQRPTPARSVTPAPVRTPTPAPVPVLESSAAVRRRTLPTMETTRSVQRRRGLRIALAAGILVALAVASFLVALGMRSKPRAVVVPADAARVDAAAIRIEAPPPIDARPADTDQIELTEDAGTLTTFIEVISKPERAVIRIGDQTRIAPAQFALPAGHYTVDAELGGYAPERREIDLDAGDHLKQEIAFTHKLEPHGRPAPQPGRLTVRTTPYSEVYAGARKLAETPFADFGMTPGVYTLTFKNPQHATVTKSVTIVAGKTTKLSFDLP